MSFVSILVIRSVLGLVKHTQSTLKVIGGDIHTGKLISIISNNFLNLKKGYFHNQKHHNYVNNDPIRIFHTIITTMYNDILWLHFFPIHDSCRRHKRVKDKG